MGESETWDFLGPLASEWGIGSRFRWSAVEGKKQWEFVSTDDADLTGVIDCPSFDEPRYFIFKNVYLNRLFEKKKELFYS